MLCLVETLFARTAQGPMGRYFKSTLSFNLKVSGVVQPKIHSATVAVRAPVHVEHTQARRSKSSTTKKVCGTGQRHLPSKRVLTKEQYVASDLVHTFEEFSNSSAAESLTNNPKEMKAAYNRYLAMNYATYTAHFNGRNPSTIL